jgi:hypothetical protein
MGNKAQKPAQKPDQEQELDRMDGKAYLFQNSEQAFYIPDYYMSTVEFEGATQDQIVSGEKYNIRIGTLKGYKMGNFKVTVIDKILLKKLSGKPDDWVAEQDLWLPPPKLSTGGRRKQNRKGRLIKKRRHTKKRRV